MDKREPMLSDDGLESQPATAGPPGLDIQTELTQTVVADHPTGVVGG